MQIKANFYLSQFLTLVSFFKMEVEFTKYKISHFEVSEPVAFSTRTVLCDHHLCLVPEHSIPAKKPHAH